MDAAGLGKKPVASLTRRMKKVRMETGGRVFLVALLPDTFGCGVGILGGSMSLCVGWFTLP